MLLLVPFKAAIATAATLHAATSLRARSSLSEVLSQVTTDDRMPNADGGSVICAGLSCLDLQLVGCTQSGSDEAIERYDEAVHCAGGSASMTGTTLALLLSPSEGEEPREGEGEEKVHILTKIGPDFAGNTLLEFYRRAGASTDLVLADDAVRTSMAVLPVFKSGKRGCYVNLACNDGFTADELLGQLDQLEEGAESRTSPTRAFLFGYPHLMPKMQGESLRSMLQKTRQKMSVGNNCVLLGVDLNGVDGSDPSAARKALIPALSEIDVLHLNEDEAMVLSDSSGKNDNEVLVDGVSQGVLSQIASFHQHGCAVVLLSLGSKGAFVSVTPDSGRLQQLSSAGSGLPPAAICRWEPGMQVRVPAFRIPHGEVNANGAGDALFSGFCLAASSWGCVMERKIGSSDEWKVTPRLAGTFASLVAWQRCDAKTRDGDGMRSAVELMEQIVQGNLPEVLEEC